MAIYYKFTMFFLFDIFLVFRTQERTVLLVGLLIITVGLVIWMPYGPGHPDVEIIGRK